MCTFYYKSVKVVLNRQTFKLRNFTFLEISFKIVKEDYIYK